MLGRVSNVPTVWTNCLAGWLLAGGGDRVLECAHAARIVLLRFEQVLQHTVQEHLPRPRREVQHATNRAPLPEGRGWGREAVPSTESCPCTVEVNL